MRLRVRLAHSISARSWASEASRTMSITNPIHERTGSGGPGALAQQLQALALILAQCLAQLRYVLLARGRDLRLDFHARGLARGERFQPHPQRIGSQPGGAVDGALQTWILRSSRPRPRSSPHARAGRASGRGAWGRSPTRGPDEHPAEHPGRSHGRDAPAQDQGSRPSAARIPASRSGRRRRPHR